MLAKLVPSRSLGIKLLIATLLVVLPAHSQQPTRIEGTVRDSSGAVVVGAEVTLAGANSRATQKTSSEGRFAFEVVPGQMELSVRASGFADYHQKLTASTSPIEIVLAPARAAYEVVVTAARTKMAVDDVAQNIAVISREELDMSAALAVDDALRQVPGFTLFRRSGSRVANPTSQGVSLRGVGASGASRALVLHDGIPLDDPFGSWVYWGRVPRVAIERVEILQGGASDLYGSDALGGVINLISRAHSGSEIALETSMGSQVTPDASLLVAHTIGRWRASLASEVFRTDGYIPVPRMERGAVDRAVGSRHATGALTLERLLPAGRAFLSGSGYSESRENGSPLQTNDTRLGEFALGMDYSFRAGSVTLRGYGTAETFHQTFSAISLTRDSETLTRTQRVPSQQSGMTIQWARGFGSVHKLIAGFDFRQVRGASDEVLFVSGNPSGTLTAGGRRRTEGLFLQDVLRPHRRLTLALGGRWDHWRNYEASRRSTAIASATETRFPDRTEDALNPRASALYRISDHLSASASVYRSFRAPTLNELYRTFRVGNILTLANEDLKAERLIGGEAGLSAAFRELRVHGGFFSSNLREAISNRTLRVTPGLITRQRQNLGRTRTQGVELGMDWRFRNLSLAAGYQFSDATVVRFPADRALEGLRLPQVPRHWFTFEIDYRGSRWTLAAQSRATDRQFEDDLNQLPLGGFLVLNLLVARRVNQHLEVFAAAENALNRRYVVGRTPVTTLGSPAFVRLGMRVHFARS